MEKLKMTKKDEKIINDFIERLKEMLKNGEFSQELELGYKDLQTIFYASAAAYFDDKNTPYIHVYEAVHNFAYTTIKDYYSKKGGE